MDSNSGYRWSGTLDYMSINCHKLIKGESKVRLSTRDDMESIMFTTIHIINGGLPWSGIHDNDEILKIKLEYLENDAKKLIEGLPKRYQEVVKLIFSLKFEDKPEYEEYIRILLEGEDTKIETITDINWNEHIQIDIGVS